MDLGAGTGIFSHQLAAHGLDVTAVEPEAAMRAKIVAAAGVTPHEGTAECTGLADGCADAVVAATAWHWFDAARASREVRRLLRPDGGGLGLLWNTYDESVAWVAEFAALTYSRRPATSPSARSGAWRSDFAALGIWQPLQEAHYPNPWTTTPDGLVDRLGSSSVTARLSEAERAELRQEAWAVLRRHELDARARVVLPYVTTVYWTQPISPGRDGRT